jgi:hypothetical protein
MSSRTIPVILVRLEYSRNISEKYSDTKFHENPSSGSTVVPCGQSDKKMLIVVFRKFAKADKNSGERGGVVVKALRYIPADSGFDSRWCHCNFSVT